MGPILKKQAFHKLLNKYFAFAISFGDDLPI